MIVKLGYVPVTVVVPAPVRATVWSGAVFDIINIFSSAPVPSCKLIPVPAVVLSAKYPAVGSPSWNFTF